jgi:hypothetical protein
MNLSRLVPLCTALLLAACGDKPAIPDGAHVHPDGTVHLADDKKPAADEHGPEHPLGELVLGDHKVQIVLLGDVVPGKEADFDVRFAAGSKRPDVLRAWVGIESGIGSMKQKFANEGETVMHGHVEVPATLPEGSKAWFEVETKDGAKKASIAWK